MTLTGDNVPIAVGIVTTALAELDVDLKTKISFIGIKEQSGLMKTDFTIIVEQSPRDVKAAACRSSRRIGVLCVRCDKSSIGACCFHNEWKVYRLGGWCWTL